MRPDAPLRDHARLDRELDAMLRRCVECGLCLPHCATWLATGNEVQSPRGRLTLLGQLLAAPESQAPTSFLEAFDLCIGCRACETACPSGVPFTLLERGHHLAQAGLTASAGEGRALPGLGHALRRLDSPAFLRLLGGLMNMVRRALRLALGAGWRPRLEKGPAAPLARLLNTVPRTLGSDAALRRLLDDLCAGPPFSAETGPVPGPTGPPEPGPEVLFFTGCASAGLLSPASRRLRELLTAAGCAVTIADGQVCCGALASHTGRPGRAAVLRRRNGQAFGPLLGADTVIVVEAAGCGLEFKEKYGAELAARVVDAAVLLARLPLPPLGSVPLKVTYHDPCHARHGQGISAEPRGLLRRIPGLQLAEPLELEVCCGSGGAWGLRHPDLSAELGRRKATNLAATGARLVVTGNPGCLGQIQDGLALTAPGLPILPLTDLLWYAWRRGQDRPTPPA